MEYTPIPLSQRIIRSSQSQPATVVRHHTTHTHNLQLMSEAVADVEKGMSIRCASEKYNIPRSTLHDHVSGKVKFGAKPGRKPYLSIDEEEELVSFLVECAKIGYPHTRKL